MSISYCCNSKKFVPVVRWILVSCPCWKHSALSAALQVFLHAASPLLGMLVLPCQISLQFSIPHLKAELLRLWLSPRCSSSRLWRGLPRATGPPVVLQHNLPCSSRNDSVLGAAVPMLTSSGGEDRCPQVPGATLIQTLGLWGCAGAAQVL